MSTEITINKAEKTKKIKGSAKARTKVELKLRNEDMEIVMMLEMLKTEMDHVHSSLDYITEPVLIDSCIYELKALHMKYQFYLEECKKRGLMADVF